MRVISYWRRGVFRETVLPATALLCLMLSPAARAAPPRIQDCKSPGAAEPWRDAHQTPECRAVELIHAMTLEDKVSHLGVSFGKPQADRFGVPLLHPNDGGNGYARGPIPGPTLASAMGVTAFPNEIALAATWDRQRASDFGKALGEEWRGKGSSEIIAPTLNLMRTWHWGRSAETFGEDPLLIGQMASAEIAALQKEHVIAMIKHFAGNNQDWDRIGHFPDFTGINEIISERALHEIYYPGFREAIQAGDAAGVMCAYNQINGKFACNNDKVLGELKNWRFVGAVTPDAIFALHDPLLALRAGVTYVGPAKMLKEMIASGQVTEGSIDNMLYDVLFPIFKLGIYDEPAPGNPTAQVSSSEHRDLSRRIIEEGAVLLKNKDHVLPILPDKVKSIAVIGMAAGPQAIVGELGPTVYVEKMSVPADAIVERAGSSMHVTYVSAGAGIRALPVLKGPVLHSSTGQEGGLTGSYFRSGDLSGRPVATRLDPAVDFNKLPADELGKQVLSFGPPTLSWSARWTGTLTPPVSGEYIFSLSGGGSATLTIDGKEVVNQQRVNFTATALGTIQLEGGKPVSLVLEHSNDYAVLGSDLHLGWLPPQPEKMAEALRAAHSADVAIVFAGEQLGEGMDKQTLNLPGDQDRLIDAVAAQNRHTIVVLNTCTPVAMPWLDHVAAVLETWYPGQESGGGIAALIFGDADPGGRLPMTFPASAEQGPATRREEYPGVNGVANFDEGLLVGYRWFDAHQQKPLFPFGFGLSYTDFSFRDLKLTLDGQTVNVSVWIKNVGSRQGSEVVQVYLGAPREADEPPSQLKGFTKVNLQPGEQKQLTIAVPVRSLSSWSEKEHTWRLSAGTYEFKVGESSRDLRLRGQLQLRSAIY